MSPTNALAATPTARMTADEFWHYCQLPENEHRSFELHRGEVVEMPRPTTRHGIVAGRFAFYLNLYSEEVGFGIVAGNDAGLILETDPESVVGPDVAFYTNVNHFEDVQEKWAEIPPLLVVEVLSPNDKKSEVDSYVRDYIESGVKVVWIADYDDRTVTVHRSGQIPEVLKDSDVVLGGDELPGFQRKVNDFFRVAGDKQAIPETSEH